MTGEIRFTLLQAFEQGLSADAALERAVVISLFTDAPAGPDDEIPDGSADRRGWWADTVAPPQNALAGYPWITGSKLWLLWRAKQTQGTANRARRYTEDALQWMIAGLYATSVAVTASWTAAGLLELGVVITLADGSLWQKTFTTGGGHAL